MGSWTSASGTEFLPEEWAFLRVVLDAQVRETARALGESLRDLLELRAHLRQAVSQ